MREIIQIKWKKYEISYLGKKHYVMMYVFFVAPIVNISEYLFITVGRLILLFKKSKNVQNKQSLRK